MGITSQSRAGTWEDVNKPHSALQSSSHQNMATIPVVRQIFILTILNSIISSTRSFLDIDEIQSTKYGIEIAGVPVLLKEVGFLSCFPFDQ